ncbi:ATP-binding SpoIIE family protein phosphatase [Massilia sp. Leaf139]|uniref:ATP-binding SpoIIE family protein phosphatase n=1 Tax=Massilia sp. Leaf139 TaxID=1736272 RepID=UPI0006FFA2CC|nr:ATP-binding SpoIIE family protein phosphatase [Massilia sp. Leaf139]KQQ96733.1 serine/threonine protein kinase [Massilia sp. Leaf139]
METLISSLDAQHTYPILHASDIAAARRAGQKLALALGFDETRAATLALIVTEAGTNLLKHAGEGVLYLNVSQAEGVPGIDVLAVDSGPGIADIDACLRDGVSTAGTAGTGLGALRRLSDEFDVYSHPGAGALFHMRLWRDAAAPGLCRVEVGAITVPLAGEDECGDAWGLACDGGGATLLAADGLGHGPEAAVASKAAVGELAHRPSAEPAALVAAAHEALRVTRGAALACARIDFGADSVRFAGVGNIGAYVIDGESRRALVSHNGIVGHNMRKVQEFSVPCPPGALVILHSDGIQTQWNLDKYPGLLAHSPALIAAMLMRDFIRRRDDAMVLVVRRLHGLS